MTKSPNRQFAYLLDPLFIASVLAYFLNRLVLKRVWSDGFVHDHLNDLICIPFWVPIMLWAQRRLGLRAHDGAPTAPEVVMPLVIWAFVFEVLMPRLDARFVADRWDVMYYSLGALLAGMWWHAGCLLSPLSRLLSGRGHAPGQ